jgi:peroxiredoxin
MKKVLLASLLAGFFLAVTSMTVWAVEIGAAPPDIQLKDVAGQDFRLSDHRGELIILKLATTWCPTCRQQSAEFHEMAAFLKEKNIRIVEVFLQDSEKMVRDYLASEQFESPFNAMIDDGQALKAYNVYLIPRVLLIDRDFRVLRDGNILTAEQITAEFEKVPMLPVTVEGH